MTWWATWWAWGILGVVFAIAEMLLPSYLFLGFAVGASITGGLLLVGGPFAGWMIGSPEILLLIFVLLSLVAWIALRRILGLRDGQVKIIDRDINEN